MKKVLLLCASHNDLGLIRGLKKLGYYIIATGAIENQPGQIWVDKYIKADYSDKETILQIASDEKIDNICACCNDYGVYTAAYVAEKLDLPGYDSYETTLILHNKDLFKSFAKEHSILTPLSTPFLDIDDAVISIENMKLPVIIKPVDCSAGNGVGVIENADDIEYKVKAAFSASRSSRVVCEPFLDGQQFGLCTFLVNEKVVAICTNNEYSIINPFRVEIDTFPSTGYEKYITFLLNEIEVMANALHLKDGIFHLQYIVADDKPWIIEVMRRTVGNMYHVLGNKLNGFDWEYWEAKARCGLNCSDFPKNIIQEGYFAYKTILANDDGVIESINIPIEYLHYTFDHIFLMKAGDTVVNHLKQPVGFLFMMFSNESEMLDLLIKRYRNDFVSLKTED